MSDGVRWRPARITFTAPLMSIKASNPSKHCELLWNRQGVGGEQTMSSREIAELTGKRPRQCDGGDQENARRVVWRRGSTQIWGHPHQRAKPGYPIYWLPKRETLILVSGYNLTMRARIIDRWQELEAKEMTGTQPIDDRVDLAFAATLRDLDRLKIGPPFPPLAQRWAFTWLLSREGCSGGSEGAATDSNIFCQMPVLSSTRSGCKVVNGLVRAIILQAILPSASDLENMHDAARSTAVILVFRSRLISR